MCCYLASLAEVVSTAPISGRTPPSLSCPQNLARRPPLSRTALAQSYSGALEAVGLDHILFETDYPHSDGTFPHSRKIAHELFSAAGMDAEACYKVLRGNALEAYGLHRFGITK